MKAASRAVLAIPGREVDVSPAGGNSMQLKVVGRSVNHVQWQVGQIDGHDAATNTVRRVQNSVCNRNITSSCGFERATHANIVFSLFLHIMFNLIFFLPGARCKWPVTNENFVLNCFLCFSKFNVLLCLIWYARGALSYASTYVTEMHCLQSTVVQVICSQAAHCSKYDTLTDDNRTLIYLYYRYYTTHATQR